MNKIKKGTIIIAMALSGCVTMQPQPNPYANYTKKEFRDMSDWEVCEGVSRQFEPSERVYKEFERRKIECTPDALYCRKMGHKPNTPSYGQCKMNYAQLEFQKEALRQQQKANAINAYYSQQSLEAQRQAQAAQMFKSNNTNCISNVMGNQIHTNCY